MGASDRLRACELEFARHPLQRPLPFQPTCLAALRLEDRGFPRHNVRRALCASGVSFSEDVPSLARVARGQCRAGKATLNIPVAPFVPDSCLANAAGCGESGLTKQPRSSGEDLPANPTAAAVATLIPAFAAVVASFPVPGDASSPVRHTLALADDHAIVRRKLKDLLNEEADLHLVAEAENGLDIVRLVTELQPDVLVTDLTMPGLDGLQVTSEVRRLSPRTRVIVISVHREDSYVQRALELGAAAYVLKSASSTDLVAAVRAVLAGGHFLSAALERDGY